MPELPEVETVRQGLAPFMEGATIERVELRRGDLRAPFPRGFARRLAGRRVVSVGRRAKYLAIDLNDGNVLIIHLGMSGSLRVVAGSQTRDTSSTRYHTVAKLNAHDHVVFHMAQAGTKAPSMVIFNDPRRFGLMDLVARDKLATSKHFAALGIEPLGNEFDATYLAAKLAGRTAPLKASLMDQRIVAGLGNIYVCEALWRARLSPDRKSGTLATRAGKPTEGAARLATAIREVLEAAIAAGGSSLRDHIRTDGELGDFQHDFAVYDREDEPCRRGDGGIIRRKVHSGRSTFYCPVCQR
jgi:formamidopyrimidine-DNA glycosylase